MGSVEKLVVDQPLDPEEEKRKKQRAEELHQIEVEERRLSLEERKLEMKNKTALTELRTKFANRD